MTPRCRGVTVEAGKIDLVRPGHEIGDSIMISGGSGAVASQKSENVGALTAGQRVDPSRAAEESVGAGAASEHVIARSSGQRVTRVIAISVSLPLAADRLLDDGSTGDAYVLSEAAHRRKLPG